MTYLWNTTIIVLMLSAISHLFPSIGTWDADISVEDYCHSVNTLCNLTIVSVIWLVPYLRTQY